MRKPFILAVHTDRPLTDLQSRRRGRLIEKTKCYREYRERMIRAALRRGERYPRFKASGRLKIEPSALLDPAVWERFDELDALDPGREMPPEQWNLEVDAYLRNARATRFKNVND